MYQPNNGRRLHYATKSEAARLGFRNRQLDYMHDIDWWRAIISQTEGVEIVDMHAMECTAEAWADWLACDNPYAQGDRAAIAAGALGYLNTIAITLRKL